VLEVDCRAIHGTKGARLHVTPSFSKNCLYCHKSDIIYTGFCVRYERIFGYLCLAKTLVRHVLKNERDLFNA
jgi:hypothetical protein